jgi:hypothetical protein
MITDLISQAQALLFYSGMGNLNMKSKLRRGIFAAMLLLLTACFDSGVESKSPPIPGENNNGGDPTPTPTPTPGPTPTPTPVPTPTPTPPPTGGTTYYIQPNGGDHTQCTGRSNANYPGAGTNQNCAWKHPFVAFPVGGTSRIAGGDTLWIASGEYQMGFGSPINTGCSSSFPWDCYMAKIPGGSAARPTRILGQTYDSGCTNAPKLWGTERASMVLRIGDSDYIDVACLEITDKASCIEQHCSNGQCPGVISRCERNTYPYGQWAGTGISAKGSTDVKLTDVNVHGLANRGIFAAKISNWEMTRVKINGNGWAGWEGDDSSGDVSNSGYIRFIDSEIAWNGCVENHVSGAYSGCWGQGGAGYGDGLGTNTSSGNWLFERSKIHHNTSDGLDLLYVDATATITVKNSWFEGNGGNQVKTNSTTTIENSVIIGNCGYFSSGHNFLETDNCRALGNAISVGLRNGQTTIIRHNTITSEGDCAILGAGGNNTARLDISNNVVLGQTDWRQSFEKTCGYYGDNSTATVTYSKNVSYNLKGGCFANGICTDPLVANPDIDNFNPRLNAMSPAIDSADMTKTLPIDYEGIARPRGPASDIGAFEK